MEWSKNTISKAELEKKQREFMEQAMRMAKRSSVGITEEKPVDSFKAEIIEENPKEAAPKEEITAEIIKESLEETVEEVLEEPFFEKPVEPVPEDTAAPEEQSYGVFDKEELTSAIERGEITGEGLRQAAEILSEMTNKTEYMKKLIEEQKEEEKIAESGEEYGLNDFINRHNNSCRGCEDGKDSAS